VPVSKFRSVQDMPTPSEVTSDQLVRRIRALWARAFTLARPLGFRGVTRYVNIEQASEASVRATVERMRATRR
jgi:hypothetical protein